MDMVTSSYLPGDPRLIDQIVYELKSQGIFDQFRKECIADVDTKPAYQNLSQRVEGSVMSFLRKQKFSENMNKNQLREQLRRNISESGFLETGVERIVDQVVNPKISTIFLPQVEDVVYRYLGIVKPNQEVKQEMKTEVVDLLPNDLEAVSPESVHEHSFNSNSEKKDESVEMNDNSLNSSNTKTEDESPPFELLEENTKFSLHEENSVDSHFSGISGLASHESGHSTEMKEDIQMDISQDITENSLNSEGNLSIVTSDEDTKMEICEYSNLSDDKGLKESSVGNNDVGLKESSDNNDIVESLENKLKDDIQVNIDETTIKASEVIEEKSEDIKNIIEIKTDEKKEGDSKKSDDNKSDAKKSHDKHKSSRSDKDKKDDKDKKSRSRPESKSKEHKDSKSHSKHSSSSKDKDRNKDKRGHRNGKEKEESSEKDKHVRKEDKEPDKSKDKSVKTKEKSEKNKEKATKDKEKPDKDRSYRDKSEKDRSDKKEKSDRDKNKIDKEKGKSEKDKPEREKSSSNKHKDKSLSSSKKDGSSKEKDKSDDKSSRDKSSSSKDKTSSSSSKHKESSSKDKDQSKIIQDKDRSKSASSSSKNKDNDKKGSSDSKSKFDKHKKSDKDKSSNHEKGSSSFKKDKVKKAVDDHYSLKDKKSERRSTDRDSNDGSSKMSRNGSFTESYSQSFKGSSKGSSEVFSSGSGNSSNSDKIEEKSVERANNVENVNVLNVETSHAIKYIKPKFASNIHEAMKIMKIRKQLAKLERQNELALSHVQVVKDSQSEPNVVPNMKGLSVLLEKTLLIPNPATNEVDGLNNKEVPNALSDKEQMKNEELSPEVVNNTAGEEPIYCEVNSVVLEDSPLLKSQDLSKESFEALEAKLAQEMSNINYNMYGEEDDIYECASVSSSPAKKRKSSDEPKSGIKKILFDASNADNNDDEEIELVVSKQIDEDLIQEIGSVSDINEQIFASDSLEACRGVSEQIEAASKENILMDNSDVIENVEELIIGEVHEECIDYIQETFINDLFDENKVIVEDITGVEDPVECELLEEYVDQDKDFQKQCVDIQVAYENDEFKGFDDVDRDTTDLIKWTEKISQIRTNIIESLNNDYKAHIARNSISELTNMGEDKIESPKKEEGRILSCGLSVESAIKEVRKMSSNIQDLLQKNGKKLFIKIDKLEQKLPSKVLVTLQGMETNEIVTNPTHEVYNVSHKDVINGKECNEEATELLLNKVEDINQKGNKFEEPVNVNLSESTKNGFIEENWIRDDIKGKDDDNAPCYYFDESSTINDTRLRILNNMIETLEKAVEKQSLQIHNNIPIIAKKRGRKRKVQSIENNNSISADCKSEPKRRHLSDPITNQNGKLCNTNVPQNQSFILPLSPAESEKSDEHKKEPVTVKTKRTGRVSLNTKRYSSEDLYKPRPVLSGSTRRRSAKLERKP